jgi:hypothetical protein
MEFGPDSFSIANPLETSPYAGSSETYAQYPQYLYSYDDCNHVADDNTAFGNSIDPGSGLIDQFPSNTVVDKLDTSLLPQRSEDVPAIVLQASQTIAPHIKRSNATADREAEGSPFGASLRSGCSWTGVKPRRRRRKERSLAGVKTVEKRRKLLEQNCVAANKYRKRKRKSEEVASHQEKEVALERENTRMKLQWTQIKDEIDNLKDMVMMHVLCNHPELSSRSKDTEMITHIPAQVVGTLAVSQSRRATYSGLQHIRNVTLPAVALTRPKGAGTRGLLDMNDLEQDTIHIPSLSVTELSFEMPAAAQYIVVGSPTVSGGIIMMVMGRAD